MPGTELRPSVHMHSTVGHVRMSASPGGRDLERLDGELEVILQAI
ncbi:hypothetical protein ACFOX2_10250 [Corynebacterium marambiense]|nr:hypothetical protein [Corynebacterium marambiense]MCX7543639.1 hypothetical protein [Corynebacterium marambiense]